MAQIDFQILKTHFCIWNPDLGRSEIQQITEKHIAIILRLCSSKFDIENKSSELINLIIYMILSIKSNSDIHKMFLKYQD